MNKHHERFLLKHRPYCEFPDASGAATCMRRSTRVIMLTGRRWNYQVAVCDDCADYAEKEKQTPA
jgi:hypothetical protein